MTSHKNKSPYWAYYTKVFSDRPDGKHKAKCNICGSSISLCSTGSTGTLIGHLKRQHIKEYQEIKSRTTVSVTLEQSHEVKPKSVKGLGHQNPELHKQEESADNFLGTDPTMPNELQFLHKKVKQLETTINTIQSHFQDKLVQVLERFFDHRADQLSKQRKALQLEEDICLDLLSYCTSVSSPDIENYDRSETSRSLNSSESKPKIAKRRHRRKNLQTRVATTNLSVSTVSKPHLTEITSEVDEGTGFCSDSDDEKASKQPKLSDEDEDRIGSDCEFDRNIHEVNSGNEEESNETNTNTQGQGIVKQEIGEIVDDQQQEMDYDYDDGDFFSTDNSSNQEIINYKGTELEFVKYNKKGGSAVWDYFLRDLNGQYAMCCNCKTVLIIRQSTGSLHNHLKLKHKIKLSQRSLNTFDTSIHHLNNASASERKCCC